MTAIVFTGPTLAPCEAAAHLDADVRGPAAQGDVYRAALRRPHCIAIVDGYFERVPAVWHKEILFALSQGIHVAGAASMGALRAAELAAYGMRGVGAIFAAYLSGRLEADDEVAVAHGPADGGYCASSEALVNMRFTLRAAVQARAIAQPTADALLAVAKGLFYPERAYPRVVELGRDAGLPVSELDAFAAWLPHGRVDRKRADALALLRFLREGGVPDEPMRPSWTFEWTLYWQALVEEVAVTGIETTGADGISRELVLDEQRLDPRRTLEQAQTLARDKQRVLEAHGMPNPGLHEAGETRASLLRWYRERNGDHMPGGFPDEAALVRALARERCAQRVASAHPSAEGSEGLAL